MKKRLGQYIKKGREIEFEEESLFAKEGRKKEKKK